MSENHNQQLGKLGEDIAEQYYLELGFTITGRNYRAGHDEIDLIAENDRTVVFVEVKTRSDVSFGRPGLAVNASKRKFLVNAAKAYIKTHKSDKFHRFDVLEIFLKSDGTHSINQIRNAFGADGRVI